jgi:hypothetical protein
MKGGVVLIGPMHAGKSTVGKALAERLGVVQVSMDDVRFGYYMEIGYDEGEARVRGERGGLEAVVKYWKPFEAHAVERLLAERAGERCVIDFGAGHSVYEDAGLFERVRVALEGWWVVVLLLPVEDEGESLRILMERRDAANPDMRGKPAGVNEHFVRDPSNRRLADVVVYSAGRTVGEVVEEIAGRMGV